MRGVGDELTLAFERFPEPVEHAIKRFGEHAHLAALTTCGLHSGFQVAGIDPGGNAGHAPQRADTRAPAR